MTEPHNIPLFPLNTVLFPGGLLPLRLFEPRYLDMIGECMREQRGFGVCAIRAGTETGRAAQCHDIGTLASISDFDRNQEGLLCIVARGERRFRIVSQRVEPDQLIRADVHWLDEAAPEPLPDDRQPLARFLRQLLQQAGAPFSAMPTDFDSAGWVADRLTELLPFALADKQRLLETRSPLQRLETLYQELLARELSP